MKAGWKTFTKRERNAIVAADRHKIDSAAAAVTAIVHPFKVALDDHCESPPEAYRDLVPMLDLVAATLHKTRAELLIYDPYYCAGAMKKHLGALGFTNVHNECVDFYVSIYEKAIPPHDVVITNPPYSGSHVEKLLRFVRGNGKPFFLLMPNYFLAKPYYETMLGPDVVHEEMLYLCPKKRYNYWTPRGLRPGDRVQKHHVGAGGAYRTSPFISFWYLNLNPCKSQQDVLGWWRKNKATLSSDGGTALSRIEELHPGVRPGNLTGIAFTNTATKVTGKISMLEDGEHFSMDVASGGGSGGGGGGGGNSSSSQEARMTADAFPEIDHNESGGRTAAAPDADADADDDGTLLETLLGAGMDMETAKVMIAAKQQTTGGKKKENKEAEEKNKAKRNSQKSKKEKSKKKNKHKEKKKKSST